MTNSWKGFFSIGSSFLGFGIFLTGISFPFFMSTWGAELFWVLGSLSAGIEFSFFKSILGAELFWELELFPLISNTSDLGSFISSELDLVILSNNWEVVGS